MRKALKFNYLSLVSLLSIAGSSACTPTTTVVDTDSTETGTGDGDGDPATGDGDGDPTAGDGDGDPTTGDGDGEPGDPLCGDGVVDPGEECDDGNDDDTDACTNACTDAVCGDGVVQAGVEECDDGNDVDDDACSNACVSAVCGDGVTQVGEDCDDGNEDNTDDCLDTCEPASCGDGYVWAGNEDCDDANMDGYDGCENDCSASLGARKVVDGRYHTCALMWSGDIMCWGLSNRGQLGYGNTDLIGDNEVPMSAGFIDLGGAAIDISAGNLFTCAILADNSVKCWGDNTFGQLGQGNTDHIGDDEDPSSVASINLGDDVAAISAGGNHVCAITDQDEVRCWGHSSFGMLGYGNTDTIGDDEDPSGAGTVDLGGTVSAISAGEQFTCALMNNGDVRCWGQNNSGQLGQGNFTHIGDNEVPSSVGALSLGNTPVVEIATGSRHACVRYNNGDIRCWGHNGFGQLGYGNTTFIGDTELPSSVGTVSVGGVVDELGLGYDNTCVRIGTEVKCWGDGSRGTNGYGSTAHLGDNELPSSYGVIDLGLAAESLSDGSMGHHNCARTDATIYCWGFGPQGQLGYGFNTNIGDNEAPSSAGAVPYL